MIFLWVALGCLSDNERTPPLSETVKHATAALSGANVNER